MRLMIDTNILIFANLNDYPEFTLAQQFFREQIENGSHFFVNPIIISEFHYKLTKMIGPEIAEERVRNILDSHYFTYVSLEKETIQKAISMSTQIQIRTNDAFIAQHVLDLPECSIATDNVRDFKKVREISIIPLRTNKKTEEL